MSSSHFSMSSETVCPSNLAIWPVAYRTRAPVSIWSSTRCAAVTTELWFRRPSSGAISG
jgi:hypothetical protein